MPVHLVSVGLWSAPSISQNIFCCLCVELFWKLCFGCKLPKSTFVFFFYFLSNLSLRGYFFRIFLSSPFFPSPPLLETFLISFFFHRMQVPREISRKYLWNSFSSVTMVRNPWSIQRYSVGCFTLGNTLGTFVMLVGCRNWPRKKKIHQHFLREIIFLLVTSILGGTWPLTGFWVENFMCSLLALKPASEAGPTRVSPRQSFQLSQPLREKAQPTGAFHELIDEVTS